eukprot:scaffold60382_cov19-Tisochrysis_lutea.AAC.2
MFHTWTEDAVSPPRMLPESKLVGKVCCLNSNEPGRGRLALNFNLQACLRQPPLLLSRMIIFEAYT